jgi:hypothetical protein
MPSDDCSAEFVDDPREQSAPQLAASQKPQSLLAPVLKVDVAVWLACSGQESWGAVGLASVVVGEVVAEPRVAELVDRTCCAQYATVVGVFEETLRAPRQAASQRQP